ncbi:MAG: ATP-dependent Zn protease [Candidatus Phytoplasma pruni]|uniref:AAA family ATPase n=1 Tax=Poinsettia branch-inducing phytoplasma TaxID=138647 RepID=UPI000371DDD7|nr:AAA family ATPase [Poinsettia branch-inducing phytoplasma]WEK82601.1 MAG: ATP-dependent Zn protease [Candidatus Phytoplasma pruni]
MTQNFNNFDEFLHFDQKNSNKNPHKKKDWLNIIKNITSILLNVLLIIGVFYLITKAMSGDDAAANKEENSWAKDKLIKTYDKTFEDFYGYANEKNELKKLVEYAQNPKKGEVERGVILYGPPGTGKTFLAKTLAGELKGISPVYSATGSDFVEKYVGVGASRIRNLFKTAKEKATKDNKNAYFIFIDEIETIGRARSKSDDNNHSEHESTLNALLANLDGFNQNKNEPQAIIIGATNRFDLLDDALTRQGRLGKHIYMGLPNLKTTEKLLEGSLKRSGLKMFSQENKGSLDQRIQEIAKTIHQFGFSAAQIDSLAKKAKELEKKKTTSSKVTNEEIYNLMDEVLLGPISTNELNDEDKVRVAIHEMGHAILAHKLDHKVVRVTIEPRGQAGGYTLFLPNKASNLPTKKDLEKSIQISLGGRIAEEFFYGDGQFSVGASDDYKKAYSLASQMVTKYGMLPDSNALSSSNKIPLMVFNSKMEPETQKLIQQIVNHSYDKALKLFESSISSSESLIKGKGQDLTEQITRKTFTLNDKLLNVINKLYKERKIYEKDMNDLLVNKK